MARLTLPLVCTASLLAGCSSYSAPELTLESVRVRERSAEAVVLEVTLNAENRNSEPLPLREVRYALSIDGEEVFAGTRSAESTLRRYGSQKIVLPAVVKPGDSPLTAGSRSVLIAGSMTYLTPGELDRILFDAEVRRPSVSFSLESDAALEATQPAR